MTWEPYNCDGIQWVMLDYNYAIMLWQDMMGFGVMCTNASNKSFVKFCVDEVFEDRGGIDMIRMRRVKSSCLGMPKEPQVNIQGYSSI